MSARRGESRGVTQPAFPPRERLAVLDFWLGRWSVQTRDGEPAGVDVVEPVLDGTVVLEHWRNVGGGEGESFFYFDAVADTWKQVWMFGGVATHKQLAHAEPGVVRFDGDIGAVPARTTLTRLADGSVAQLIEQSPDGGATWQTTFDAVYTRLEG
jgi:hypothetical protein